MFLGHFYCLQICSPTGVAIIVRLKPLCRENCHAAAGWWFEYFILEGIVDEYDSFTHFQSPVPVSSCLNLEYFTFYSPAFLICVYAWHGIHGSWMYLNFPLLFLSYKALLLYSVFFFHIFCMKTVKVSAVFFKSCLKDFCCNFPASDAFLLFSCNRCGWLVVKFFLNNFQK